MRPFRRDEGNRGLRRQHVLAGIAGLKGCSDDEREGSEGRVCAIPPSGTSREGRYSRVVAIPNGYTSREGADGRVVAIPPGRTATESSTGRIKLVPEDQDHPIIPPDLRVKVRRPVNSGVMRHKHLLKN